MGTALTEGQMEALWRLHPEPTLCFDGDGAGKRAASRAIDRALPHLAPGKSFRFAALAGGKDPDDILRDLGPAALKASWPRPPRSSMRCSPANATPLLWKPPNSGAGLKQRLRAAAKTIADGDLAGAYRDAFQARLDALFAPRSAPSRPRGGSRGGRE